MDGAVSKKARAGYAVRDFKEEFGFVEEFQRYFLPMVHAQGTKNYNRAKQR